MSSFVDQRQNECTDARPDQQVPGEAPRGSATDPSAGARRALLLGGGAGSAPRRSIQRSRDASARPLTAMSVAEYPSFSGKRGHDVRCRRPAPASRRRPLRSSLAAHRLGGIADREGSGRTQPVPDSWERRLPCGVSVASPSLVMPWMWEFLICLPSRLINVCHWSTSRKDSSKRATASSMMRS